MGRLLTLRHHVWLTCVCLVRVAWHRLLLSIWLHLRLINLSLHQRLLHRGDLHLLNTLHLLVGSFVFVADDEYSAQTNHNDKHYPRPNFCFRLVLSAACCVITGILHSIVAVWVATRVGVPSGILSRIAAAEAAFAIWANIACLISCPWIVTPQAGSLIIKRNYKKYSQFKKKMCWFSCFNNNNK